MTTSAQAQPTTAPGESEPNRSRGTGSPLTGVELSAVGHSWEGLQVLAGIDLTAAASEVVAIVGPSGCGKSTLLELIAGLASPSTGTIAVGDAEDPAARLGRSVLMPQRDLLLPWLRALDNAGLGLRLTGASRAEARERAMPLFQRLGLAGFERARPDELSGGMRQRVAFARTLLTGKPLLLLDEPFAALDAITRADLQGWLLRALSAEPRTVILVTHDVEEALLLADRTLVLSPRPGRIVLERRSARRHHRDRAELVSDPAFVAAREAALRALRGGER